MRISSQILRIYDYMATHRRVRHALLMVFTLALMILLVGQTYKEDISDFLPLGDKYQKAMQVYQQISGANRLLVTFQRKQGAHQGESEEEADSMVQAIADFEDCLRTNDTDSMVRHLVTQIDYEQFAALSDFTYTNIPYFLTDTDYQRMDSLLSQPGYIARQMAANKQMLMFPVSTLLADNMGRDPLNLFTPVVAKLQKSASPFSYELYDGHIFTPDMQRAIVTLESPYGSSETENNARLLRLLQQTADSVSSHHPQFDIHFVGGPAIAVGNAQQIKRDSMLAVTLAVVLIVALLYYAFRSWRRLLLIVVSIAWGWLFAIAALSLVHNDVSVIVVGISSIILGIAVNYPLHLIDHLRHTPHVRQALHEIVMPLLVGNITTVGAFLALVPLRSVALRDLGLFSSFLLLGTILFVLIILPHWVAPQAPLSSPLKGGSPARKPLSSDSPPLGGTGGLEGAFLAKNKREAFGVAVLLLLTCVFGYFSLRTSFDADISHINYINEEQKADMAALQGLTQTDSLQQTLYVVSEGATPGQALDASLQRQPFYRQLQREGLTAAAATCTDFLCSETEQKRRLHKWQQFTQTHAARIEQALLSAAKAEGFADDSFGEFLQMLHASYQPQPAPYFERLASTAFAANICANHATGGYNVIDQLVVNRADMEQVRQRVEAELSPSQYAFDIANMNSAIANSLSDDFNYIGWACGLIVFFFLWFSLGSIELAMLSFLPMAVSWVWILGLMSLFGIQFNVVNVILATFIFGQGDDYTIFITEGCQYEYAYRRKMLSSYKHSIVLSALIMFIGIGALIFARHPALRSLAQVTIVGMFSVVLMAWLIPPFIFRWLVSKNGRFRRRPITLRNLVAPLMPTSKGASSLVLDRYRYKGSEILSTVRRRLRRHDGYAQWTSMAISQPTIVILNAHYGEFALLMALTHPEKQVIAYESDPLNLRLAAFSAEGIAPNLTYRAPLSSPLGGKTQRTEKLFPQGEPEGAFLSPQGESEGAFSPQREPEGAFTIDFKSIINNS